MPEEVREKIIILGKVITQEILFVLFAFCNPTDNFDVAVEATVFILADFVEDSFFLLLAIWLVTLW